MRWLGLWLLRHRMRRMAARADVRRAEAVRTRDRDAARYWRGYIDALGDLEYER